MLAALIFWVGCGLVARTFWHRSLYVVLIICAIHVAIFYFFKKKAASSERKVAAVVVLGDVERSPRIVNQAICLARCGWRVELFGFVDRKERTSSALSEQISIISLQAFFRTLKYSKLLYAATAFLVAVERFMLLLYHLCFFQKPYYALILVQNPPSIPTLAVAWFASYFIHRAAFVIDWHNFGYTMMEVSHAPRTLVSIARAYEKYFGELATANFCVCAAAQNFLQKHWKISSVLLYDCPTERFRNFPRDASKALLKELYVSTLDKLHLPFRPFEKNGRRSAPSNLPLVAISSTSWTPDENMHLLLDVCIELDRRCALKYSGGDVSSSMSVTEAKPELYIIITGKGPQRASFEERLMKLKLRYIVLDTFWLRWEEYVQLLKTADFGISLHFSSSGIDLPMKVVDMFACGLPVLSYRYGCIDELIHQGQNGLLFETSDELCDILEYLLSVEGLQLLSNMREYLKANPMPTWEDEWQHNAKPVLESIT
ncbi:hypothetical protein GAYE_PCTG36G1026 [Galdieria yellowstonensis]|uniref:Beta-1,4-mannosyltransferase n=1 Tax=Galdieria yellowstonensis TaxID=3028027 RepID=A0AAV9I4D0_9RHOD|nr:hypothetical protein GAYE_PCTG36G1026 [Galdieria yellowstonensis]